MFFKRIPISIAAVKLHEKTMLCLDQKILHMSYDINNIFAKILRAEIPCKKVYEDEFCLAFHDIYPAAPIHVIVIPKSHYIDFSDFCTHSQHINNFFQGVQNTIHNLNLENGYRLITNSGIEGLQTVQHFHIHILAGEKLGPLVVKDKHHL